MNFVQFAYCNPPYTMVLYTCKEDMNLDKRIVSSIFSQLTFLKKVLDKLASECYNILVRYRSDSDRQIENYFKNLQKST